MVKRKRQKLPIKLNFRVSNSMRSDINNAAMRLGVRPSVVVRESLAVGIKTLLNQQTAK